MGLANEKKPITKYKGLRLELVIYWINFRVSLHIV